MDWPYYPPLMSGMCLSLGSQVPKRVISPDLDSALKKYAQRRFYAIYALARIIANYLAV